MYDNLWEISEISVTNFIKNRGQNMTPNQQYKNLDFVRISRERLDVLIMAVNAAGPIGDDE